MPSKWQAEFDRLIAEDERSSSLHNAALVGELRDTVHDISRKLDRLTDLYIAQDIERDDYLARRRISRLGEEVDRGAIGSSRANAGHWLEPMRSG